MIGDGPAIAASLREVAALPRAARAEALRAACRPYVEVATMDDRDEATRHPRFHLWRYFRHTWASRYRRPPGRHVAFLVRDAAQPGHPVMAITALCSTPSPLTHADEWMSWTTEGLTGLLDRGVVRDEEVLAALRRRVREDVAALYTADLGFDGAAPPILDDELERELQQTDRGRPDRPRQKLSRDARRWIAPVSFDPDSLLARTVTPLFRGKRASTARTLLGRTERSRRRPRSAARAQRPRTLATQ